MVSQEEMKARLDSLSLRLKSYVLRLIIFPKGYWMEKKRLLYWWIAQGIVTDVKQGEELFNDLVSKEFIEVWNTTNYWATCRVTDTAYEVLVSAASPEFLLLGGGKESGGKGRAVLYLSVHGNNPPWTGGEDRGSLRSLSILQQPQDGHKLLDRLGNAKMMRVLDLQECKAVENQHVEVICKMVQLKFLSLRGTNITGVPGEISKLKELIFLDLCDTHVASLPDSVTDLVKLQYLYIYSSLRWDVTWRLPRGIKKMKALRFLSKVGLDDDAQVAEEIGDLPELEGLYVILYHQVTAQNLTKALSRRARGLQMLHTVDYDGYSKKLNLLNDISEPPINLQYAKIAGLIDKLPDWMISLRALSEVNLSSTGLVGDQILSVLCTLPALLVITLSGGRYTDSELVARAAFRFPTLEKLYVVEADNDPEVLRFEQGSMPTLKLLDFRFGERDKKIIGVEHLTGLEWVYISGSTDNKALSREAEQLRSECSRHSMKFSVQIN